VIKIAIEDTIMPIILFSIILNLAAGVVGSLPAFDNYGMGGLTYSPSYNDNFEDATQGINNTIAIAGDEVTNTGSQNSVLDFLSLKSFVRMFAVLDSYLFGFVNVLANIFNPLLNSAGTGLGTLLFAGLKSLLGIGYALLMFYWFTGRSSSK